MAFLKDTENEQLRQLVKACLLEISKQKIELKKCQRDSSRIRGQENINIKLMQEEHEKLIQENEAKIKEFIKQLQEKETQIANLQKFKDHFRVLTSKPKKDLTSFQSQIYMLLPDRADNMENLFDYLRQLGFQELTTENFEHALRNLERKGYFRSTNDHGQLLWKKLEKD
jgi:predicted nuclease with TOPRIM domain